MLHLLFAPLCATVAILIGELCGRQYVANACVIKPEFRQLWQSAIRLSVLNIWFISVFLHSVIDKLIVQQYTANPWYWSLPILILCQHVTYHGVHFAMHKWIYRIHQYHHKFNDYVVPVSGIAVSHAEFLLAYACPVILGLCLGKPTQWTLALFLATEYCATIFVHCGFLETSQHKFIVTPAYHCAHHGKCPNQNLSAPMLTFPDLFFKTQHHVKSV